MRKQYVNLNRIILVTQKRSFVFNVAEVSNVWQTIFFFADMTYIKVAYSLNTRKCDNTYVRKILLEKPPFGGFSRD